MTDIYKQYEKAVNGLIPVTRDLINELRFTGNYSEAEELVKVFRSNCIKQKIIDKKNFESINNKKEKMILKNKNICYKCKKNKPMKNKNICEECYYKRKEYYEKEKM